MLGLEILCGALIIALLLLTAKLLLIKKSAAEISEKLKAKLNSDTNTLIDISSGDKDMRRLAAALNTELERLGKQRRVYLKGDRELKNAITNISHDLRTPLTALCGYLELLAEENLDKTSKMYLTHIFERTEAMKRLTEELFRYSVSVSEKEPILERVCINDILEESIASFYGAVTEREITPVISLTEKRVMRISDKTAISRIFSNIISNALKYSAGDFFVAMNGDGEILFKNSAKNLDKISTGKLFDRFYTVEDGSSSTGLGLSIAKALTQRLGGEIGAEKENGMLVIWVKL